ncbi:transposase [Luteimonas aestuarii]|uniref:transposase n=1 Tax=Luteimonas aestuarii TaxID=453837 RepID=UPI002690DA59
MARQPRFDLAGVPQHVVQRGNNRLPCFLDDDDRQRYLQCLRQGLARFDCQLHAYVLMSNHVHLLLTPASAGAVSRLMHTFARNYTGLFNGRHGRTGTLWEGRFKACLVDSDPCFPACSRYIEHNPVRAWMVARPADYPWSSHGGTADTGRIPCWSRTPGTWRWDRIRPSARRPTALSWRKVWRMFWSRRSGPTCSSRRRWERTGSRRGSRSAWASSRDCEPGAGRRPAAIVPATFSRF